MVSTAEALIEELQRKYRVADQANRQYIEQSEEILRKQRISIDALTKDNKELVRSLALQQSQPRDVEHRLACARELAAIDESKILMGQIEELGRSIKEHESSIELIHHRLTVSKSGAKDNGAVDQYMSVLERRLNHSVIKFNELLATNSSLRDEVDTYRVEKASYQRIRSKLVMDIESEKQRISHLIDSVNSCYCSKDKAIADLNHLRLIADREHFEFEKEWRELNSVIGSDTRVHQLISEKHIAAANRVAQAPQPLHHSPVSPPSSLPPLVTTDSPAQPQLSSSPVFEHLLSLRAEVNRFESIFARIKESVGVGDVEELLEYFNKEEMQNYSLFNHTNSLALEIEKLTTKIESEKFELNRAILDNNTELTTAMVMDADAVLSTHEVWDEGVSEESTVSKMQRKSAVQERLIEKIATHLNEISFLLNLGQVISSSARPDETLLLPLLAKVEARVAALLAVAGLSGPVTRYSLSVDATTSGHHSSGASRGNRMSVKRRSTIHVSGGSFRVFMLPSSVADLPDDLEDAETKPLTRAELEKSLKKSAGGGLMAMAAAAAAAATAATRTPSAASTRPGTSTTGIRRISKVKTSSTSKVLFA